MKPLLITLDFINDITPPDGKIPSCADFILKHDTITQANQAIALARKCKHPVIHVKVGFSDSYIECPLNSPLFGKAEQYQALQLNTWGTEFHEVLDTQACDTTLIKHRVSALYATALETILSANQIDTVILCGVSTNMAVETLARELHDRDYRVIILENACAAADSATHEAALKNLCKIATMLPSSDYSETLKI